MEGSRRRRRRDAGAHGEGVTATGTRRRRRTRRRDVSVTGVPEGGVVGVPVGGQGKTRRIRRLRNSKGPPKDWNQERKEKRKRRRQEGKKEKIRRSGGERQGAAESETSDLGTTSKDVHLNGDPPHRQLGQGITDQGIVIRFRSLCISKIYTFISTVQ